MQQNARMTYRLDELGWPLFERLCTLLAERDAGVPSHHWVGSADAVRIAWSANEVRWGSEGPTLPGPVLLQALWCRPRRSRRDERERLALGLSDARAAALAQGAEPATVVVLSNAVTDLGTSDLVAAIWRESPPERIAVLGARQLGSVLDARVDLRAHMPPVLATRTLAPLLDPAAVERSAFDFEGAVAAARTFVPGSAYARAVEALRTHGVVVLGGPPGAGKATTARMLGLAMATAGWEVHEVRRPSELTGAVRPDTGQVFLVLDDFGGERYDPGGPERWERELPAALRSLDVRHWLVWAARTWPLAETLERLRDLAGRFPGAARVRVDVGTLSPPDRVLLLARHARAADVPAERLKPVAAVAALHADALPEALARLVVRADPATLDRPTPSMVRAYAALDVAEKALLVARLDAPSGPVGVPALEVALSRHAPVLAGESATLLGRVDGAVLRGDDATWLHPAWPEVVGSGLQEDAGLRRRFLDACGIDGTIAALGDGRGGFVVDEDDWDRLTRRLPDLVRFARPDDLLALVTALDPLLDRSGEAGAFARRVLEVVRRRIDRADPPPALVLEAWLDAASALADAPEPPDVVRALRALEPSAPPAPDDVDAVAALDDWLAVAQAAERVAPEALEAAGLPAEHLALLDEFAESALLASPLEEPAASYVAVAVERLRDLGYWSAEGADTALAVLTGGGPPLPPPSGRFDLDRLLEDG